MQPLRVFLTYIALSFGAWITLNGCSAPIMCDKAGGGFEECPKEVSENFFEKRFLGQKWYERR